MAGIRQLLERGRVLAVESTSVRGTYQDVFQELCLRAVEEDSRVCFWSIEVPPADQGRFLYFYASRSDALEDVSSLLPHNISRLLRRVIMGRPPGRPAIVAQ